MPKNEAPITPPSAPKAAKITIEITKPSRNQGMDISPVPLSIHLSQPEGMSLTNWENCSMNL